MPRPAKRSPVVRLNLEVSPALRATLDRIQDATDAASAVEVIRRAVAMYDLLLATTAAGGKLVLRAGDGEKELLFVG